MDVYEVELDSAANVTAQLALFRRVRNAKQLKEMVVAGELKCCMIKPSLILDPFQVAVAAHKAVLNENDQRMTTRSVFTEVIYNLSVSKNISQSLNKFGISDDDENVLVVAIQRGDDGSICDILPSVAGELCSMEDLTSVRELPSIKKVYNVRDEELSISSMLDSVVSRIAAKEFVSFK
ncbi:EKC/KEOPS complex subunit TPRKB-like [Hetaerina americana]|uniref:EKC/KEOPS complex subunit TPRKB-like n=1 Tax=Hetaerina americana TaxID=62018 RepID=UPI003A7F3763